MKRQDDDDDDDDDEKEVQDSENKIARQSRNKDEEYEEEEDMLDPMSSNETDDKIIESWEGRKRTRDAKATRALLRKSQRIKEYEDIEGRRKTSLSSLSSYSRADRSNEFLGEEKDIDSNLSLLYDHDYNLSSSTSSVAGKKNVYPIEPFNLKSEREDGEGYFAEGDTYIFRRRRLEGEEEDAWVDQLHQQQQQELESKPTSVSVKSQNADFWKKAYPNFKNSHDMKQKEKDAHMTKHDIYQELARFLAHENETVLQWVQAGYFIGTMAVDGRHLSETKATETVQDLLDDLYEATDPTDVNHLETKNNHDDDGKRVGVSERMRSDHVNFTSFL